MLKIALDRDLALGRTRDVRRHLTTCLIYANQIDQLIRVGAIDKKSGLDERLLRKLERSVALGVLRGDDRTRFSGRARDSERASGLICSIIGALNKAISISDPDVRDHGWGIYAILAAAHEQACALLNEFKIGQIGHSEPDKALVEGLSSALSGMRKDLLILLNLADAFVAQGATIEAVGKALKDALLQADLEKVKKIAGELSSGTLVSDHKMAPLVWNALDLLRASTIDEQRQNRHRFVMNFLAHDLYKAYCNLSSFHKINESIFVLAAIVAREAGSLPAWEGIRIVRERSAEGRRRMDSERGFIQTTALDHLLH
jgi:hypothetical protein